MANPSMFAIPAYWLLCMLPHNYTIAIMRKANNGRWDNIIPDRRIGMPSCASPHWRKCVVDMNAPKLPQELSRDPRHLYRAILAGNTANLSGGMFNIFCGDVSLQGHWLCRRVHFGHLSASGQESSLSALMCIGIFIRAGIWRCRKVVGREGGSAKDSDETTGNSSEGCWNVLFSLCQTSLNSQAPTSHGGLRSPPYICLQ
ncbi:hypothetical protein DL98DRAFT_519168 [Cadophora sp. DSE1049]|nr:hypothetical protein DL98DRAFT_519168 [Cadophora sp. DSE1049]